MIRDARHADAPAIAALHIASWQSAYRGALPDAFLDNQSLEDRTDYWHDQLDNGTRVALLEAHSDMLGFAASGPTHDRDASGAEVWQLYNLHITPDRRRGGLGGQLFAATVDVARAAARHTLSLWVVTSNASARTFYEKHGMAPDGRTQVHELGPGAQLHELRYRMSLTR